MRILGVAQDAGGKWGALYAGLAERHDVVAVLRPDAPRRAVLAGVLGNWRINLAERTRDPSWSVAMFDSRTRVVDAELARRGDDHDVIVQAQTLFAPGAHARRRPYVIYTDSTAALNARFRFGTKPPRRLVPPVWDRERSVALAAGHVFTMSEFARRSMVDDYGVDPARVTAVGAGVNVTVEAAPPADRPRAILVGIDFERKGGAEVLRAWPRVRAAVPDAELVMVGMPEVRELEGVRWTGRIPLAEVSRLYAGSTVFVCPTLWDPWGLVFHEAMAHGLPCIGTDGFAVPEIIADGETGLLVPPRDPEAVAEALIALLGDPARAAAMGAEARRRVAANATWSAVAAKMAPALEALVTRR